MAESRIMHLTVVVPREVAPTVDDAIDLVGDKLRPLFWTGKITEEEDDV